MMELAMELESAGQKIYRLDVGQPGAPTPKPVLEEAARLLQDGRFHYCSALGAWELREAIAVHYHSSYGLEVNPESVVIVPGSSLGLYASLLVNFTKGAKIAVATPTYPCYRNVIRSLGYQLLEIPTRCEEHYLLTPENLAASADNIDGILIGSPGNPTGTIYDKNALKALSDYCKSHNIRILADELYHGVTYEEKAATLRQFSENDTVISGFSKYFCMTGWRVGWMIVPQEQVKQYDCLLQNLILCSSTLNQLAAVKAFSAYKELDAEVAVYKTSRDILYDTLLKAGLKRLHKPQGAFYQYIELGDIGQKSVDLCKKLLYEENIATAPGLDFKDESNTCSIRVSFCKNPEIISQAAVKLASFIQSLAH